MNRRTHALDYMYLPKIKKGPIYTPGTLMVPHYHDEAVLHIIRPNMQNGPWVAGGAVLSWYMGQKVGLGDIDVWVRDAQQEQSLSTQLVEFGFRLISSTANALTYKRSEYSGIQNYIIQIIKRKYFSCASEVIDDFDLTVCQLVTDGSLIEAGQYTLSDIHRRVLRFNKVNAMAFKRLIKYQSYGFLPTADMLDWMENNQHTQTWDYINANDYDA